MRRSALIVIPAKAGIPGQEVTDLLAETPAFAGVTCPFAGATAP